MQVLLALDTPDRVFTNLDYVKGRVILRMPSPATISNITVKLEGEATTQLMVVPPGRDGERPRPVQELHKVLYYTDTVFNGSNDPLSGKTSYTMAAGNYEYPFNFKIPFNNTCHTSNNMNFPSIPNLLKGTNQVSTGHIKSPLPPTLGGFPGMASIRYFVKVTVKRKEFFKENPRVMQYITFLPIEPPRPPPSSTENYGRRAYEFLNIPASAAAQPGLKRIFTGLKSKASATSLSSPIENPSIEVEARLPEPAILTSNQPIPLRILVRRRDAGDMSIWLQTLHVELVGHTKIRASAAFREEVSIWPITSHSNMNQLLDFGDPERDPSTPISPSSTNPSGKAAEATANGSASTSQPSTAPRPARRDKQLTLNAAPWSAPLPQNVAPTFETCNIKRWYMLEARIGIGVGTPSTSRQNQVILPLRLACQVYSGVAPPQALLDATAARRNRPVTKKPLSAQAAHNAATAAAASQAPQPGPSRPQNQGPYAPQPAGDDQGVEEPPPSYEDAMAQELGPVDGPRAYRPAAAPEGGDGFATDAKRRGS